MERLRERESVLHDAVPRGSLEFKIPYLFRTSWKKDAVRGRSLTGEATVMVWRWEDVEVGGCGDVGETMEESRFFIHQIHTHTLKMYREETESVH